MTKTKRIQILCLLGAVTLLLSGCWTEAPVESANGLLGDQEPADQQEEVILPAAFTLPYDPDHNRKHASPNTSWMTPKKR